VIEFDNMSEMISFEGTHERKLVFGIPSAMMPHLQILMYNSAGEEATEDYMAAWDANAEPGDMLTTKQLVGATIETYYWADVEALPSLIQMLFEPIAGCGCSDCVNRR
jgi:hypothetical protein